MAKSTVSMKLLIDTQSKRVLYAEASKDCLDFLIHILALPMANVISLLKKQGMVGSLGNLYDSVENLNDSYLQSDQSKSTILRPAVPKSVSSVPLLPCNTESTEEQFYRCGNCYNKFHYVSVDPRAVCPSCGLVMNVSVSCIAPPSVQEVAEEGGYVKGVVTYTVMDDLEVKPMSTISSITMLNKFKIKDVGMLEERVVSLGMTEAVKLLKSSLQSNQVLTDVFLS